MDKHLKYMKLAIREAEKARGTCSPNPFVGAVIVRNDAVIAKGHTQDYGGDHAEADALKQAGKQARGASLYVTLEPCSHFGKTPACTEAIIKAGIRRVFFGIRDPNPLVKGDTDNDFSTPGILSMQYAGIEVQGGLLSEMIELQLESYLCRTLKHRPFVIWKAALSIDGKYAANDGSARWISNEKSRRETHRLREAADVVLTGIGTVLADDPQLHVRLKNPRHQPMIALLDPYLEIPLDAKLISGIDTNPLTIFHGKEISDQEKHDRLQALGAILISVPAKAEKLDLISVLKLLFEQGTNSVLLECGSKLASSFFAEKLVDKCHIFFGNKLLGGRKAILSELPINNIKDAIELDIKIISKLENDIHVVAYPIFS
ncbi:MAG: bifunctional diaminohydroxyphosphoribosylaminopyrimidine deaminase/5-amino-6-(5-phosphoribosylamino)uracil reductase RibD [Candidatus Cloacimonadaceae bacterium]|nr:bifunctional diaminohydroxyphosphoribosylaminopyrimidine deaminase/5-amino-6-(5-phosphoribosylamino)uracil reductase RibD [Candidatus Cloacimonadaceae bacterium]